MIGDDTETAAPPRLIEDIDRSAGKRQGMVAQARLSPDLISRPRGRT